MPGILRLLSAGALVMALCAFGSCGKRPDRPRPEVIVQPAPVIVERRVYVSVPKQLTAREATPEGPIAQCFDVAAQRRAVIERLGAKLEAIEAIQGTEVKP